MCFAVSVGADHSDSSISEVGFVGQKDKKVDKKVVGVMRRMTTVMVMVVHCRVDFLHVLTKDSAVTGAQLCKYSSCLPLKCLFGCSNGRRSAIEQF